MTFRRRHDTTQLPLRPGIVRRVIAWRSAPAPIEAEAEVVLQDADAPPSAEAVDLCRRARRLRATLAHDRVEMHRQLRDLKLADEQREQAAVVATEPSALPGADEAPFQWLVRRTIRQSDPLLLRYTERLELLAEARRRGIGRFQANLIIASVEHELRAEQQATEAESVATPRFSGWVLFAAVQSAITTGVWRLVR